MEWNIFQLTTVNLRHTRLLCRVALTERPASCEDEDRPMCSGHYVLVITFWPLDDWTLLAVLAFFCTNLKCLQIHCLLCLFSVIG